MKVVVNWTVIMPKTLNLLQIFTIALYRHHKNVKTLLPLFSNLHKMLNFLNGFIFLYVLL